MKNITILAICAICLLSSFTGLFRSATDEILSNGEVDESAISSVMSSKISDQFKVAYSLLKSSEKLELWNRHIKYFIKSHDLTPEQLLFVMEFKNQWLSEGLFEESSPELNKFTKSLPEIKYQAQSILGIPDAFSLLMDLQSDSIYYAKASTLNANSFKITSASNKITIFGSCGCSQADSYCNAGNCRSANCVEGRGCGTLFLFTCNGICSLL